ncbi:MAG: ROK family protein, partial [Clostridia bacterium]|nr:ROK family protein [Clostridia bacterium]
MTYYIGVDIGGTKCAVVRGDGNGNETAKVRFPTTTPTETQNKIYECVDKLISEGRALGECPVAIGVSCGSPMDSRRGIIQEPPNLLGWVDVPIVEILNTRTGLPAFLCNDANACALAEWRFGAGRGTKNMIFCTFGTGFGAGLILDGKLYAGTNDNAGEIGHVRLDSEGPMGYYKVGSVEGFCSGGGLRQLGQRYALRALKEGKIPSFCPTVDHLDGVTALSLANAAHADPPDEIALAVWQECGRRLGYAMAILIDLLNPERIVLGSIYARSADLLADAMNRVLREECLVPNLSVCEIVPAELTETVGDMA